MSDQDHDNNMQEGSGPPRRYGRSRSQELDLKEVKYYNVDLLRRYLTEEGKIRPRRQTKVSAKAQRRLAKAIKQARALALLPYTSEHIHDNG